MISDAKQVLNGTIQASDPKQVLNGILNTKQNSKGSITVGKPLTVIEVVEIEGGHRIIVSDTSGVRTLDVMDGVDGYTPQKGIDYFDGGKGDKGDAGYTPIKGTDYFDGDKGDAGKSAYEIAVENGFEGNETEWLESLRGKDGMTKEQILELLNERLDNLTPSRVTTITLYADAWKDEGEDKYSQVVAIDGVTSNSQVDLTPTDEQLAIFRGKELALTTKNVGGVVTAYAIGDKPTNDYTMQVTITEVEHD